MSEGTRTHLPHHRTFTTSQDLEPTDWTCQCSRHGLEDPPPLNYDPRLPKLPLYFQAPSAQMWQLSRANYCQPTQHWNMGIRTFCTAASKRQPKSTRVVWFTAGFDIYLNMLGIFVSWNGGLATQYHFQQYGATPHWNMEVLNVLDDTLATCLSERGDTIDI